MKYIRWILTAIMVALVYKETGIFTAIAIGGLSICSEIESSTIKKISEILVLYHKDK